jgi:hypothetical protein
MYSKVIKDFEAVNIKLLRSIDDICKDYDGIGIEPNFLEDSNIESGEICQLTKTPNCYHVGYFNNRGSGKSYYAIINNRKFVEDVDFIFY